MEIMHCNKRNMKSCTHQHCLMISSQPIIVRYMGNINIAKGFYPCMDRNLYCRTTVQLVIFTFYLPKLSGYP